MTSKLRIALIAGTLALVIAAPAQAAPAAPSGLSVTDLVAAPEAYDPQLSWAPAQGAKGYEVEINSSSSWATGSKVCCKPISFATKATTYGRSFSPTVVLENNTFQWRVRAIDSNENAGPWVAGPSFTKRFANAPDPSVTNLRLVDRNLDTLPAGSVTDTPIVLWDPVPGASSYQVGVAPFEAGACDWSAHEGIRWDRRTATTGWTPLGWNRGIGADPLANGDEPAGDMTTHLTPGMDYCVRVLPVDNASINNVDPILGDWVYLPANNVPAFTWSGPPAETTCDPSSCSLTADDYLRPGGGTFVDKMPVFTWSPIPGAESYFVVVAKDPAFTTIVDYSYTRVPAYAPRAAFGKTKGYADETTNYYWAVLPADKADGHGVSTHPVFSSPQPFKKSSTPPNALNPTTGKLVSGPATTFRWSPVTGARRYRVQVSDDPTFVNTISDAVTDSTAYTSNVAYPGGKTLYWRVSAEAEDGPNELVGLSWSNPASFTKPVTSTSGGTPTPTPTFKSRFNVYAKGFPAKLRYRTVSLRVRNHLNKPVYRAAVHVSGAGVGARTKYTGKYGWVSFRLRATRYPAYVTFRITKSGYYTKNFIRVVRLP